MAPEPWLLHDGNSHNVIPSGKLTNLWNIPIFNTKYIFIQGPIFQPAMLVYQSVIPEIRVWIITFLIKRKWNNQKSLCCCKAHLCASVDQLHKLGDKHGFYPIHDGNPFNMYLKPYWSNPPTNVWRIGPGRSLFNFGEGVLCLQNFLNFLNLTEWSEHFGGKLP